MSDRDILDLIDLGAAAAPPMHVAPDSVIAGGRRRLRRRRAAGAGGVIGTLALAGFLWVGAGGPTGMLGTPETPSASVASRGLDQGAEAGPVGPGGQVVLLGEVYDVAVDDLGWPMLLEADGTVFISVAEEQGEDVSTGGQVRWRQHWWPWSARKYVYFSVDEPLSPQADGEDLELQDVVTIEGPAGQVHLGAVAGS